MADDWDLHAVVGGRAAAAAIPIENHVNNPENLLPELASANLTNDHDPFYHLGISENKSYQFPGLEEIYRKFDSQPKPICSSFSIPVLGGQIGNQQQIQIAPPPQHTEQQLIQPQFRISRDGSSFTLPNQPSQTVRSRKKKNEQKKLVRQMTHEELLADSWAWRKYGQKPIKGSPYPRNYYRCSTSKGCLARKQVEISPSDPNIYVVSYTGEHNHPPPTHRNSLAGSRRNKYSGSRSSQKYSSDHHKEPSAAASPYPCCSSSSPISSSSLSPATPLMEEGESAQNDDEAEANVTENNEDLLIPNLVMSEDILKGFQELRQGFSTP